MSKILNYMTLAVLLVIFVSRLTASAQVSKQATCQLDGSPNGTEISVRGTVVYSPHDLLFAVRGCKDVVVLEFSVVKGTRVSSTEMQSRKNSSKFERYIRMQEECPREKNCMERPAYKVDAILIGRLDVGTVPDGYWKDGLGYLHDHSGKITGKFGFGHPPAYKYRLVITEVSKVVARRRNWSRKETTRRE
jgi:hypothetical protein